MSGQPFSKALLKRDGTRAKKRILRRVRKEQGRRRALAGARRSAELQAMPKWVDRAAITALYRQAVLMGQRDGQTYHVDHIVPLRGRNVCGLHVPWNLQILTSAENVKKGNRFETVG
jgi:5-methylcytosine-specific restriction endonuclease McrA